MSSSARKNSRQSVSAKMIYSNIFLFVLLAIAFTAISYALATVRSATVANDNMSSSVGVISGLVSDHLRNKVSSVRSAAANEELIDFLSASGSKSDPDDISRTKGYKAVCKSLDEIAASDKDIVSVWVASENSGALIANDGRFLSATDFMLTNRYWYRENSSVMDKYGYVCTAVSESIFDSSASVATVISPVCSNGTVIGYVGAEFLADSLGRILSRYTLNSGCYPVISSEYGSFIYTPSSEDFTSRFNVNRAPLLNILTQPSSEGVDSFTSGYNTIYYSSDSFTIPGWNIVCLFDSRAMNGGIYIFFSYEVIVMVCLLVLTFIIIRNKLSKEIKLIPLINKASDQIASGIIPEPIDTKGAPNNDLTFIAEKINTISRMMQSKNDEINNYISLDALTGLPNRVCLYDKIDGLIAGENGEKNNFAIMFVDIDNFKWLNETMGHNFGDAVLSSFAETIQESVGKLGSVYRFSGDEFIIIVEFGRDYDRIQLILNKLRSTFNKRMRVMEQDIFVKFSVGVAIYPDDDESADMLLRDAELALHRAKENGKDRIFFYSNTAEKNSLSKAAIANQITSALKANEMHLCYQPIISADSRDIHGFEVLLRWDSLEFGKISPADFIGVAEESGEIVRIGTWIFESACRFLKQICDNYRDDIIMSINVSPIQLRRSDYLEHVRRVIEITQVNPANIQIEITESSLIDFIDSDNGVIKEINDMGIAIALDDFGTGYSSLNYLKNFPVKCLKIDKSFVDEINNDTRDYAITDSIIDLVHSLGIQTVAEGIETVGQYKLLREMKCDFIQGYLMSKPLDESDAIEFVENYETQFKPDDAVLEEHERQLADERRELDEKLRSDRTFAEAIGEQNEKMFNDEVISK